MTDRQLKTIELTPDTDRLVPGDRVQLGFCTCPNIVLEHLWVRTCQMLWNGKFYFGVLEEDAKCIEGLKAGQRVKFGPKHVARLKRLQTATQEISR